MKNNKNNKVTEFGFVQLYAALAYAIGDKDTINKYLLEDEIVKYRDNEKYSKLFEDITFHKTDDKEYVDLSLPFSFASTLEIVTPSEDAEVSGEYFLTMESEDVDRVIDLYDRNIIYSMINIYTKANQSKAKTKVRK